MLSKFSGNEASINTGVFSSLIEISLREPSKGLIKWSIFFPIRRFFFEEIPNVTLLFFKIEKQHSSILKTILFFLNYMPHDEMIDIELNQDIMTELRKI